MASPHIASAVSFWNLASRMPARTTTSSSNLNLGFFSRMATTNPIVQSLRNCWPPRDRRWHPQSASWGGAWAVGAQDWQAHLGRTTALIRAGMRMRGLRHDLLRETRLQARSMAPSPLLHALARKSGLDL